MPATKRKATGAHFTPPGLGILVAERLGQLMKSVAGPIRVLDPACGDGNLLRAMVEALPKEILQRVTLVGIESDAASFAAMRSRQPDFGKCRTELIKGDFLDLFDDRGLFGRMQAITPSDSRQHEQGA